MKTEILSKKLDRNYYSERVTYYLIASFFMINWAAVCAMLGVMIFMYFFTILAVISFAVAFITKGNEVKAKKEIKAIENEKSLAQSTEN